MTAAVPQAVLSDLREIAIDAAEAASAVLLAHRRSLGAGADLAVSSKTSATDPVSIADADSERVIVEHLAHARPDDGLLGEEGAAKSDTTGIRWVIDPLDGTVNYLYDHVGWAVSIAAEARGPDGAWEAVTGVVLEPLTGARFAAVRGGGATLESPMVNGGRPVSLRVNEPVSLPMALVATGFSYDRDHRREQAALAAHVAGVVRDVRRVGSAALDLCSVAAGRCDAYYEDSTRRWDWAAGALIAEEAGAVVSRLTRAGHSGVLAAGPTLHGPLLQLISR